MATQTRCTTLAPVPRVAVLNLLTRLRMWLVVRLLWRSPSRLASVVRGFQATEADGVWHLHRGIRRTHDPKRRAILFTHSLEEESHAEEFGRLYSSLADRPGAPAYYERHDLLPPAAPLWKSLAYVHVGEEDATDRFRHLQHVLPESPLKTSLARIVADEATHVDLTHDMLVAMGASERDIRSEVLRVRLGRAWENWLRAGKRVVDVIATVLLSVAYVVVGAALTIPARRRLASHVVEYDNNRVKALG